ncbi:MAG: Holliday junction branch migration protein RuvA [Clostridia bacterium]|nr:Holliday junction branch migration protein RuvA [Clostridia bacterium]
MLNYIKGKVTGILENGIVLENNGIGYQIFVPQLSIHRIMENREELLIYTEMILREDSISLYGFVNREDIGIFKKLMTVNGVGAKAALSIMSTFPTAELQKIIAFEDDRSLVKAPGIGKKTAQRIVLELKDKLGDIADYDQNPMTGTEKGIKEETIEALVSLGYSRSEALDGIRQVSKEISSVEDMIKYALIALSKQ